MLRFLLLILLIPSFQVMADSWSFPPELKMDEFMFGDLKIQRTIDTRNNSFYPEYKVNVFKEGKEIANYKNLTFDFIQTFDEGNFLFAGSNSGLSQFAFFILAKDGGLVMTKIHSKNISYCGYSVTLFREWLPKNIEIVESYKESNFTYNNETQRHFTGAKIKDCQGNYIELFE